MRVLSDQDDLLELLDEIEDDADMGSNIIGNFIRRNPHVLIGELTIFVTGKFHPGLGLGLGSGFGLSLARL